MQELTIVFLALLLSMYEIKEYKRTKSKLILGATICTFIIVVASLTGFIIKAL